MRTYAFALSTLILLISFSAVADSTGVISVPLEAQPVAKQGKWTVGLGVEGRLVPEVNPSQNSGHRVL